MGGYMVSEDHLSQISGGRDHIFYHKFWGKKLTIIIINKFILTSEFQCYKWCYWASFEAKSLPLLL